MLCQNRHSRKPREEKNAVNLLLSGTEVNKLTTSNKTCDSDLPSLTEEFNSTNSEEFLTVYWALVLLVHCSPEPG